MTQQVNRTRKTGKIKKWDAEKGFGFIKPNAHGGDVFLHITDYSRAHTKPYEGLEVSYSVVTDNQGRKRAAQAKPLKGHRNDGRQSRQKMTAMALSVGLMIALCALCYLGLIPTMLIAFYVVINILTFIFYAHDKSAAHHGRWRTPEATLHTFALLGGWAGAAIAQSFLRHKSKKLPFKVVYWLTVGLNCLVLFLLTMPENLGWLTDLLHNLITG